MRTSKRTADRHRGDAGALWEAFARRDPQHYIDPTPGPDVPAELFILGGRPVVDTALEWAGEIIEPERALEIGCGIGRNTVHLASRFGEVHGVDVSPTMVSSARERGLPENVRLHVVSGRDLSPFDSASFSFVFSHLVFQHIPDDAAVESYMHEIARVLRLKGIATLQFDTRRSSLPAALAQRLPDRLLPELRRRGIRRYSRPAARIREYGRAAGLSLEAERNPDSADHWFRWRR